MSHRMLENRQLIKTGLGKVHKNTLLMHNSIEFNYIGTYNQTLIRLTDAMFEGIKRN